MKTNLCAAFATGAAALALVACDATPASQTASPSVEPAPSDTRSQSAEPEAAEPEAFAEPGPAPAAHAQPLSPEQEALRDSLVAVTRNPDAYARARKLGELLPTLGPDSAPVLASILEDARLDFGATEIELLARAWATQQPDAATRWAVEQCPPAFRTPAVLTTLSSWARQDPQAALAATETWSTQRADLREILQIGLVLGWFEGDPQGLVAYIEGMAPGIARQRAIATYLRALILQQGTAAAMLWAESVPDDEPGFKLSAYRQVAAATPLFDHEAALRWCEAHCDGPYGNNMRSIIARRWVLQDGAGALAWLSTAPEGHERDLSVRVVFAIWSQSDPTAAMAWMAAQPRGEDGGLPPWLRPAVPVYARALARTSPLEAIRSTDQIADPEEREIVLIDVVRTWRDHDEAAAEAWMADSSLSEDAREKVRGPKRGLQPPTG